MRQPRLVCFGVFLLGQATSFAALAAKPIIPLGVEFQVNTYTTGRQRDAAPALDGNGGFVIAWHSSAQDGSGYGVFGRRFDTAGVPLAMEFQVNTYTSGVQGYPGVATRGDGSFVVVWESQQDGYSIGIFARRFNSSGVALAAEFQVNGYTTNHQRKPSLAMISNGSFVVAWESYGQDGSQYGIFARRFDSSGTALGAEFQVNSNISGAQTLPAVGVNAEGGFVIAWEDHSSLDGSGYGIFARRFDAAGTAQASEFQVNSHTPDSQRRPSVAVGDLGDFVIAWQGESDQDGAGAGVFARRFNAAGIAQAGEFQVNSYTAGSQQLVDLSIDSEGTLVASWASGSDQDGSSYGVFARRFDSLGDPLAVELQINSYTSSSQGGAAVSTNAAGDFVVAWASYHDGSEAGVFAQRFKALAVLDVDGDGSTAALTDGLLVLRFLFGFTGSTLINGAVGNGCTGCDAGAIAAYIQTLV